jgi:hypothetical protein
MSNFGVIDQNLVDGSRGLSLKQLHLPPESSPFEGVCSVQPEPRGGGLMPLATPHFVKLSRLG